MNYGKTYFEMPTATIIFRFLGREFHARQLDDDLQTLVSELFLQIDLVVVMAEVGSWIAVRTRAFLCRPTSFPLIVCVSFTRLGVQNLSHPVELPVESLAHLNHGVVLPSAIFERLVLVVIVSRNMLGVIGQRQVLVDSGYPCGVSNAVVVGIGRFVVPFGLLARFNFGAPSNLY